MLEKAKLHKQAYTYQTTLNISNREIKLGSREFLSKDQHSRGPTMEKSATKEVLDKIANRMERTDDISVIFDRLGDVHKNNLKYYLPQPKIRPSIVVPTKIRTNR